MCRGGRQLTREESESCSKTEVLLSREVATKSSGREHPMKEAVEGWIKYSRKNPRHDCIFSLDLSSAFQLVHLAGSVAGSAWQSSLKLLILMTIMVMILSKWGLVYSDKTMFETIISKPKLIAFESHFYKS